MKRINTLSIFGGSPIFVSLTLMLGMLLLYGCQDSVINTADNSNEISNDSLPTPAPINSGAYVSIDSQVSTMSDDRFKVYDAMRFMHKPDNMYLYGLSPIKVIYAPQLWYRDISDVPNGNLPASDLLHLRTKQASNENKYLTMVDIEQWPTKDESLYEVQQSVKKYCTVVDRMNKIRPDMNVGFFGMCPIKNFNHRITEERLDEWRHDDHYLRPMADKVEALFLKSYTYWQDRDKWATNLKNNIAEARRLAADVGDPYKKVYVVLWPEFPWGFDYDSSLNGTHLSADYWRFQLDTARKYADGIVIWSPTGQEWDGSAPWWAATKNFLKNLGKGNY